MVLRIRLKVKCRQRSGREAAAPAAAAAAAEFSKLGGRDSLSAGRRRQRSTGSVIRFYGLSVRSMTPKPAVMLSAAKKAAAQAASALKP